jgi:DNA-binding response OmpR family regulator
MKVLVVDDAPDIAEVVGLCFELRWPGTTILTAGDGETALAQLEQESPELVILDIGLGEMDGFQVCKEMRRTSSVPIIMLTVRDEDVDIARGLESGADDYITKPFSHIEFLARTNAVMRRISGSGEDPVTGPFVSGDLYINLEAREIWLDGEYVRLHRVPHPLQPGEEGRTGGSSPDSVEPRLGPGQQRHHQPAQGAHPAPATEAGL